MKPKAFTPTHRLGYDKGVWIPVRLSDDGKTATDKTGERFAVDAHTLLKPIKQKQPTATNAELVAIRLGGGVLYAAIRPDKARGTFSLITHTFTGGIALHGLLSIVEAKRKFRERYPGQPRQRWEWEARKE